jgi:hypothetical protein
VQLKSLWKVSAMALIVRMRNLNVLTEWQYNSLMRDATARDIEPVSREELSVKDRSLLKK